MSTLPYFPGYYCNKPQFIKDLLSNRYIRPFFLIRVTGGAGGSPSSQRVRGNNTSGPAGHRTRCVSHTLTAGGNSESNQTIFCFQSVERKPAQEEQDNSTERPELVPNLEPCDEAVMRPFTQTVNFINREKTKVPPLCEGLVLLLRVYAVARKVKSKKKTLGGL